MLDGYPVLIGDTVHILGIGAGQVVSVNADGGFTVRTGSGDAYYRDGGFIGNQRRVYWADPMIVVPPKNRRLWRAFISVATVMYKQLETVLKMGGWDETVSDKPVDKD